MFFKMKNFLLFVITSLFLVITPISLAEELYWLCGPDEDGCPPDAPQFCFCIPHSEINANKPYCLDFDELSCSPLTLKPNCDSHFIFKDQTSCLATIFHSIPDNPCTLTAKSFCTENHTAFCDESGKLSSCKYNNKYKN